MVLLWTCLGLFGGYICTSILLLKYPTIIHRKKKQSFKCKHISHRGGAGECLENTIGAFKNALATGTDMFEIDVQLTNDGEVVVAHDNHLERMCGEQFHISDVSYGKVPLLKEKLDVTFSFNDTITCQNGDRKIPKLRTVFELFPDMPINIDIKSKDIKLIEKTLDLIYEFNRKDLVVVGNASSYVANIISKKDPDILLLCSAARIILIYFLFYTGLLPFFPIKESFFEIPMLSTFLRYSAFGGVRGLILRFVNFVGASPVLFRHLQRRGFQVYLFVINEEQDFHTCFNKYKVDGIMTDYPTKLTQFLNDQSSLG